MGYQRPPASNVPAGLARLSRKSRYCCAALRSLRVNRAVLAKVWVPFWWWCVLGRMFWLVVRSYFPVIYLAALPA